MSSLKPPQRNIGFAGWLRENLFSNWWNSLISLASLVLIVWSVFGLVTWIFNADGWHVVRNNLRLLSVFTYPPDLVWRPFACAMLLMFLFGMSAGVAKTGTGLIIRQAFYWFFGLVVALILLSIILYVTTPTRAAPTPAPAETAAAPEAETPDPATTDTSLSATGETTPDLVLETSAQRRPLTASSAPFMWLYVALFALAGFAIGRTVPSVARILAYAWGASWFVAVFILSGFGPNDASNPFRPVDSKLWGGILLSFFLSITGIALSFPIGIALALGRQSKLPVIKWFCTVYIEIIRGAPLVTWLFMASLILPLMLGGITPPALVRVTVAITLFAAAYMAENVRGGLQALPKGQYEAARALGLNAWDTTFKIILPQALRAVIPAIVGLFIGLFKDTSLVTIVGLSDLFETARKVSNQPETLGIPGGVTRELFVVMALFYWFFSYRMSVASKQLEKQLGLGTR
ncbi:MAG: amino acid ABC transporter permease [Trueperaceae bacterium]